MSVKSLQEKNKGKSTHIKLCVHREVVACERQRCEPSPVQVSCTLGQDWSIRERNRIGFVACFTNNLFFRLRLSFKRRNVRQILHFARGLPVSPQFYRICHD